jgi:hypothetical protein
LVLRLPPSFTFLFRLIRSIGLIVVGTLWRSVDFLRDFYNATEISARRELCWSHLGNLILDIPTIFGFIIITATLYRFVSFSL